ncbi:hypothetical protein [Pueribacillus sp. YX66]|uniref:hypothetical protein n=1 Tax=Pueribacillus sp. YX66 TaxID=3229242 RepID=UPI00358CF780
MSEQILQQILTEIQGLNAKVNGLESDMNDLKTEVNGLKSDMNGLKSEVSGLKSDMNGLKSKVSGLKSDMNGLKSEVSGLKSDMNGLKSEVSGLKSETQGLKTEIQDVKSQMNSRFDTLETRISNLEVEQRNMKEVMATKDNIASVQVVVVEITDTVKRIEKTQDSHDHILDILSRRTIEHEAEINILNEKISKDNSTEINKVKITHHQE